ncbi:mgtE intracellular region [Candidatus Gastranaerophilus sp. (ex Termes propinquus)]|nr:mgtE intracellular region [Candidatus Gastranaerophilus sp. (ex Termes propinquus)]
MIELNVDLSFLSKYFELTTQRLSGYASKSINEIMKEEERLGNPKAAGFESALRDPAKVAELFMLMDPQNRYLIIRNLSSEDLSKLLPHLNKADLIWGLKYFTKDKLMELMEELPKKELYAVVMQNFTMEDILKLMPKDELDKFLESDKIEKQDIMKYFKQMDYKDLQKFFTEYFGKEMAQEGSPSENSFNMLQTIESLSAQEFQKMIMDMNPEAKQGLIFNLVENKPELLMEFQNKSIARPMMLLEKPDILKSLQVLENEFLIKMVDQLPDDLIQVVATQIDPKIFADILIDKFPDVIKQIAL